MPTVLQLMDVNNVQINTCCFTDETCNSSQGLIFTSSTGDGQPLTWSISSNDTSVFLGLRLSGPSSFLERLQAIQKNKLYCTFTFQESLDELTSNCIEEQACMMRAELIVNVIDLLRNIFELNAGTTKICCQIDEYFSNDERANLAKWGIDNSFCDCINNVMNKQCVGSAEIAMERGSTEEDGTEEEIQRNYLCYCAMCYASIMLAIDTCSKNVEKSNIVDLIEQQIKPTVRQCFLDLIRKNHQNQEARKNEILNELKTNIQLMLEKYRSECELSDFDESRKKEGIGFFVKLLQWISWLLDRVFFRGKSVSLFDYTEENTCGRQAKELQQKMDDALLDCADSIPNDTVLRVYRSA